MTVYTAQELGTAAKIARQAGMEIAAQEWEAAADKALAREHYAEKLGKISSDSATPFASGVAILATLTADGWTPPEGLI